MVLSRRSGRTARVRRERAPVVRHAQVAHFHHERVRRVRVVVRVEVVVVRELELDLVPRLAALDELQRSAERLGFPHARHVEPPSARGLPRLRLLHAHELGHVERERLPRHLRPQFDRFFAARGNAQHHARFGARGGDEFDVAHREAFLAHSHRRRSLFCPRAREPNVSEEKVVSLIHRRYGFPAGTRRERVNNRVPLHPAHARDKGAKFVDVSQPPLQLHVRRIGALAPYDLRDALRAHGSLSASLGRFHEDKREGAKDPQKNGARERD